MTSPANVSGLRRPVLYPHAPQGSLAAKRPDADNSHVSITGDRYYRQDIFDEEWERIWTRIWHLAGPVCDLRQPGDFFTYDFMHESFLVVMQEDRSVKGFYNVCPHRGNRLVYEEHGSVASFACLYHAWTFDKDGRRLSIKDPEAFAGIDTSRAACLTPLRCEVHAGLVWVNMDGDAPPVREALGLPEGLVETYRLDEMVTVSRQVQEVAGNWKLAFENVVEGYHFDVVHHPGIRMPDFINPLGIQYDLHTNGASSWFAPFGEPSPKGNQIEVNEALKGFLRNAGIDPETFAGTALDVRPAVQKAKREHAIKAGFDVSGFIDEQFTDAWGVSAFPNSLLAMNFEVVLIQRFQPHSTDPQRYFMTPIVLYRPGSVMGSGLPPYLSVPGMDLNPTSVPKTIRYSLEDGFNLGPLIQQDVDIIERTMLGVRSRGFKGPVWGEQEQRLAHFHAEYDRYMSGAK